MVVRGRWYELSVEREAGARTMRQIGWIFVVSAVESHLMILFQLDWRHFTLKSGDLPNNMDREYITPN